MAQVQFVHAERAGELPKHTLAMSGHVQLGDRVMQAVVDETRREIEEEVPLEAAKCGLAAIALTDHDTIGGISEARAAGHRLGVRVIAACELSAFQGDHEVHILALHLSQLDALEKRRKHLAIST